MDGAIAPGVVIREVLRAVEYVSSVAFSIAIANLKVEFEAVAFFDTRAVVPARSFAVILSPEVVGSFPLGPGVVRTNDP